MTEKILTLHPQGKVGVNIDREKYDLVRRSILGLVGSKEEIAFKDLAPAVGDLIGENFDGSISWYVTTVKLDLEARGIITRVPKAVPQRIRLAE